jgi:hypothetical protein
MFNILHAVSLMHLVFYRSSYKEKAVIFSNKKYEKWHASFKRNEEAAFFAVHKMLEKSPALFCTFSARQIETGRIQGYKWPLIRNPPSLLKMSPTHPPTL